MDLTFLDITLQVIVYVGVIIAILAWMNSLRGDIKKTSFWFYNFLIIVLLYNYSSLGLFWSITAGFVIVIGISSLSKETKDKAIENVRKRFPNSYN
jgi:hypothetical protein